MILYDLLTNEKSFHHSTVHKEDKEKESKKKIRMEDKRFETRIIDGKGYRIVNPCTKIDNILMESVLILIT